MRRTATVIAVAAALTAATVTPATAHSGTYGPYPYSTCEVVRKKLIEDKHKVSPCLWYQKGYVVKFWH